MPGAGLFSRGSRRHLIIPRSWHIEKILGLLILFEIGVLFIYYPVFTQVMFIIFLVLLAMYLTRAYAIVIFAQEAPEPAPPIPPGVRLPSLSVVIALHNEELVVAATVRKMAELRYPDDRFALVFILDNCTDQTAARLDETVRQLGYGLTSLEISPTPDISELLIFEHPNGRTVQLIIRDSSIGGKGKAPALNAAFQVNDSEIIGIYDADHRPDPDNALIATRWLLADPTAGCVQGPCFVLNGTMNILTRLIFFEYISLNRVEQPAKAAYGGMVCFEGANGFFRREAIERSGGFDPDNLAEDTYLSFKLAEVGYRCRFDPGIRSYEQCPESFGSWYRQRLRWARGWFQCARQKIFRVGRLNRVQKLEGEYLLMSGFQSIIIMLFLLLFPLTAFYFAISALFGYSPIVSGETADLFSLVNPVVPFFYTLAILTPLLQGVIGAVFLSHDNPDFMAENRSVLFVLFIFPLYSIMQGFVALFALIDEFVLHKPLIWVKTPRSQLDEECETIKFSPFPGSDNAPSTGLEPGSPDARI